LFLSGRASVFFFRLSPPPPGSKHKKSEGPPQIPLFVFERSLESPSPPPPVSFLMLANLFVFSVFQKLQCRPLFRAFRKPAAAKITFVLLSPNLPDFYLDRTPPTGCLFLPPALQALLAVYASLSPCGTSVRPPHSPGPPG